MWGSEHFSPRGGNIKGRDTMSPMKQTQGIYCIMFHCVTHCLHKERQHRDRQTVHFFVWTNNILEFTHPGLYTYWHIHCLMIGSYEWQITTKGFLDSNCKLGQIHMHWKWQERQVANFWMSTCSLAHVFSEPQKHPTVTTQRIYSCSHPYLYIQYFHWSCV